MDWRRNHHDDEPDDASFPSGDDAAPAVRPRYTSPMQDGSPVLTSKAIAQIRRAITPRDYLLTDAQQRQVRKDVVTTRLQRANTARRCPPAPLDAYSLELEVQWEIHFRELAPLSIEFV
jgi:hypothetical protein